MDTARSIEGDTFVLGYPRARRRGSVFEKVGEIFFFGVSSSDWFSRVKFIFNEARCI